MNLRISRREALKIGALAFAALAFPMAEESRAANGPFVLPPLPYPADALEPIIGAETMRIHHDKHHQAYVDKLNKALEGHAEYQTWSLEDLLGRLDELPESIRRDVRNHGGGHLNHSMFWESMAAPSRASQTAPDQRLNDAITRDFGSLENLKSRFQEAGAGVFGSGWVWLAADPQTSKLAIRTTANQDSLLLAGFEVPLLGNDVWEHAYYLNYQNRRADYLKAWWGVVDWNQVSRRFAQLPS
jgi:Fe-Mn family superoxide dismutase